LHTWTIRFTDCLSVPRTINIEVDIASEYDKVKIFVKVLESFGCKTIHFEQRIQ